MVGLGELAGGLSRSVANAISADASTIVGASATLEGDEAFLWTEASGMRRIEDVLTGDFGLDLTDWTLQSATAVSADGQTIVGFGNRGAWIAVIPEPSSMSLLVLGLASIGLRSRRRRN